MLSSVFFQPRTPDKIDINSIYPIMPNDKNIIFVFILEYMCINNSIEIPMKPRIPNIIAKNKNTVSNIVLYLIFPNNAGINKNRVTPNK